MSKRAWLVLPFLLFCLTGCGNRDKQLIRTALQEMEAAASFSGPSPHLVTAADVKRLGAFFTRDVSFGRNVVPMDIDNRQVLESAVFYARSKLARFSVRLREEELEVDSEAETARMLVVAEGSLTLAGETERLWKDLEVRWRKTDGAWRISRIEVLESIRRPD